VWQPILLLKDSKLFSNKSLLRTDAGILSGRKGSP
jgi:hypothetical protein